MSERQVRFSGALPKTAKILSQILLPSEPLVIRDLLGRISIALDADRAQHADVLLRLREEMASLGAFAGSPAVLCSDDFFEPAKIFNDPSIMQFAVPGTELSLSLLDRQVTGQEWTFTPKEADSSALKPAVPTLAFFGLKGGVGRSTALAMLAYNLAKSGKRVLLIDLDLESPGLSRLLLPLERLADFGIVDWLVEDAVGQGAEVCERMISVSPLSDNTRGEIRLAAASGREDDYYLDKLSRVYAEVSGFPHLSRFSDRVRRLIETLKVQESPDVILIDSRAGLHDLAGLSIVGLASIAFLYSTVAAQSWQGYRSLFSHWQCRPEVARYVRERLKIVSAMFPESDQAARSKAFLEHSYSLFADTLYDDVRPGDDGLSETELFNFDISDSSSPHYPLRIRWSGRFQEFDPLEIPNGLFREEEIRASYGEFLDGAAELIEDLA